MRARILAARRGAPLAVSSCAGGEARSNAESRKRHCKCPVLVFHAVAIRQYTTWHLRRKPFCRRYATPERDANASVGDMRQNPPPQPWNMSQNADSARTIPPACHLSAICDTFGSTACRTSPNCDKGSQNAHEAGNAAERMRRNRTVPRRCETGCDRRGRRRDASESAQQQAMHLQPAAHDAQPPSWRRAPGPYRPRGGRRPKQEDAARIRSAHARRDGFGCRTASRSGFHAKALSDAPSGPGKAGWGG